MGRQPFLTRLAFVCFPASSVFATTDDNAKGRSPFEPSTSVSRSREYDQIDPARPDVIPPARNHRNQYVQLYDERGAPINPRAHEHGRVLRQAQNDVLSAVGVVARRSSGSEHLPGAHEERLAQLEQEDSVGNAIALASTLTENACTWWIGSLKDRLLTFRFPQNLAFTRIVAAECHSSGVPIMYAGFPARLLGQVCVQSCSYIAYVVRPLDQSLYVTHASRKTIHFFQQWANVLRNCFRTFVEIMFYPFIYHSSLQRLGLLPARPLFPHWRTFVPFSPASPLHPLSLHAGSAAAGVPVLSTLLTSPVLFACLSRFVEHWVYAVVFEAIESSIIHPENPDIKTSDDGTKAKASAILGLRQESPSAVRNVINKCLAALGWAQTPSPTTTDEPEQCASADLNASNSLEGSVAGLQPQITSIRRLSVPALADSAWRETRPPPSPTASEPSHNGEDPRIRITSREGIVEMEVRLPPQVLTSQTEVFDEASANVDTRVAQSVAAKSVLRPFHRVTHLSTEPAQMLGAICKAQIVGLVILPLKLVTLHLIALHYLRRTQVGDTPGWRALYGLGSFSGLRISGVRAAALLLGRVALCSALEISVDLALWGAQCSLVTYLGRNMFRWGSL